MCTSSYPLCFFLANLDSYSCHSPFTSRSLREGWEVQRLSVITERAESVHVRHLRPRSLLSEVGHPQRSISVWSTGGIEGEESFGEVESCWRKPSAKRGGSVHRERGKAESRTYLEKVSRSLLSMAV